MENRTHIQHQDRAIERDNRFTHVMALTLNPADNNTTGIIRCITSREGDVSVSGYIDRSELYLVQETTANHFSIGERLVMQNEEKVLARLSGKEWDFLGFEDPDIFINEATNRIHLYFTIAFKHKKKGTMRVGLGHAEGNALHSLEMTLPVLEPLASGKDTAKEVSIAPLNSKGIRHNLIESNDFQNGEWYSTVRVATAKVMGKRWKLGNIVFHPAKHGAPWISAHASPGPLLPRSFIDLGGTKLLGIMNGRAANQRIETGTKYGAFSIGLFIYNYEKGAIEWVSEENLIQDTEAETITFASQFVETAAGEGMLYAHVDDSFVRAYILNAEAIGKLFPDNYEPVR